MFCFCQKPKDLEGSFWANKSTCQIRSSFAFLFMGCKLNTRHKKELSLSSSSNCFGKSRIKNQTPAMVSKRFFESWTEFVLDAYLLLTEFVDGPTVSYWLNFFPINWFMAQTRSWSLCRAVEWESYFEQNCRLWLGFPVPTGYLSQDWCAITCLLFT